MSALDDDEKRQRETWRRLRDQQEGSTALAEALKAVGYMYPNEKAEDAALRELRERIELAGYRLSRL